MKKIGIMFMLFSIISLTITSYAANASPTKAEIIKVSSISKEIKNVYEVIGQVEPAPIAIVVTASPLVKTGIAPSAITVTQPAYRKQVYKWQLKPFTRYTTVRTLHNKRIKQLQRDYGDWADA